MQIDSYWCRNAGKICYEVKSTLYSVGISAICMNVHLSKRERWDTATLEFAEKILHEYVIRREN